jgi:chemotaxis protein MotB
LSLNKSKKISEDEAEDGEAWLMSYADLITLLLAVFVLLFSLSSVDGQKAASVTKAIASYLNTKTVDNAVSVGDVTLQERQLMALRMLSTYLDLGHPDQVLQKLLSIQEKDEEIRKLQALAERLGLFGNAKPSTPALKYEIVFPENILFKKNSPYLSTAGLRILKVLTPKIQESIIPEEKTVEIAAEVNGQKNPPPGFSSNHIFAAARAEAVSLILQRSGINSEKIKILGRTSEQRTEAEPSDSRSTRTGGPDLEATLTISILTPQEQVQ